MNKCQNAKTSYRNWLLLVTINLIGLFSLATFVSIKSASAADGEITDVAKKELSTAKKLLSNQEKSEISQRINLAINRSKIDTKKTKIITPKIDSLGDLGNVSTEAKKLFPLDSQSITQKVDSSNNSSDNLKDVEELRQNLLIEPLVKTTPQPKRTYQPGLSFGTPSAFGAAWGDLFIGASAATAGKARDGNPDGSMSAGFGIGNSYELVGIELAFNNGSIKNFGYNGTFDLKAHRVVYVKPNHQIAVAGGWNTFAQYGNEGIRPSGAYGVITSYSFLQPENPVNPMAMSFSLGAGGGDFRQGDASTGIFGGVGVQVHPQIGMGVGWSGVGLNAGVSVVPIPTIPFTITAQGADLTDNSPGGTVFVLTVGYGFNFLPR
ncbi:hypothetical protein WJM97_21740 [Okeanomitos corallinicola TIOX110]|uniref:Outer membrane protein beta-barrel domain-containing protein n=1 Tax=Okeanomitos corallinicola TIOX110 TaxID=3133117 RepID=A0ABZ2URE9_9CYAN